MESLKESPNSGTYLSYDVIFMILVRLPVKSLLQLKLVCSLWRSIISDPHFIKAYLDIANDVHKLSLRRYISFHGQMKSMGFEDCGTRLEHTIPVTDFSGHVEFLGSCNGLLILGDDDRTYYLWNPSTRLLKKFNGPPLNLFRGEFRNFGLGYDSTSSAYKVVRIVHVCSDKVGLRPLSNNSHCYNATTVTVYNCKTDRWKKIEGFPYVIFENAQGITLDGAPHWVMFRDHLGKDGVIDLVIVYFDVAEEKFKEIPKPNWLVHSSIFELGVFEGLLCLIHYEGLQLEVWVMQKHGQDSWIKLSFGPDSASSFIRSWISGRTILYERGLSAFAGITYVESLVSPHGGSDMIG